MRILGIDPGLGITGYGCISMSDSGLELVEAGVIRTKKTDQLPQRLTVLFDNITELLKDVNPNVVVIEELYSHYKHPRTAIVMGHARGTLLLAAGRSKIDVVSYGANRIKKSLTGNGHATKEQIQLMIKSLLELDEPPKPPDVADALAVALCHINVINHS